jgi:hypothetical protein
MKEKNLVQMLKRIAVLLLSCSIILTFIPVNLSVTAAAPEKGIDLPEKENAIPILLKEETEVTLTNNARSVLYEFKADKTMDIILSVDDAFGSTWTSIYDEEMTLIKNFKFLDLLDVDSWCHFKVQTGKTYYIEFGLDPDSSEDHYKLYLDEWIVKSIALNSKVQAEADNYSDRAWFTYTPDKKQFVGFTSTAFSVCAIFDDEDNLLKSQYSPYQDLSSPMQVTYMLEAGKTYYILADTPFEGTQDVSVEFFELESQSIHLDNVYTDSTNQESGTLWFTYTPDHVQRLRTVVNGTGNLVINLYDGENMYLLNSSGAEALASLEQILKVNKTVCIQIQYSNNDINKPIQISFTESEIPLITLGEDIQIDDSNRQNLYYRFIPEQNMQISVTFMKRMNNENWIKVYDKNFSEMTELEMMGNFGEANTSVALGAGNTYYFNIYFVDYTGENVTDIVRFGGKDIPNFDLTKENKVSITKKEEYYWFQYTPTITAEMSFISSIQGDPRIGGNIYDDSTKLLASEFISDSGKAVSYRLQKGHTYFIAAYFADFENIGEFILESNMKPPVDIANANASTIANVTYTGMDILPSVTLTYEGKELVCEQDFTVTYENNRHAGTAQAIVTGIETYDGTITVPFTIEPKALTISDVQAVDRTYDGTNLVSLTGGKLAGVIYGDDIGFVLGDGTLDDPEPGMGKNVTVTIALTGERKNNYKLAQPTNIIVTINEAEEIPPEPIDITTAKMNTIENVIYTGTDHMPAITLTHEDKVLTIGKDYNVKYENNRYAGTAQAIITGIEAYNGTLTVPFTIEPKVLTITDVQAINRSYNGTSLVILTGGKLVGVVNGDEVGFTLGNGILADPDPGIGKSVTVNISLSGEMGGNYELIQPTNISVTIDEAEVIIEDPTEIVNAVVDTIPNAAYTGNPIMPSITLTYEETKLVLNEDYTISYEKNRNVGIANIIVTGIGHFSGTRTIPFMIEPKQITIQNIQAVNRDYNGTKTVTLIGGQLIGVANGDSIGFTLGNGILIDPKPGIGKNVAVNISLTGTVKSNYKLIQPTNIKVNIHEKAMAKLVKVSPANTKVKAGKKQRFIAKVSGDYNPSQSVIWKVAGNKKSGTKINTSGVLTVAAGESAKKLTITAISKLDYKVSGKSIVTVTWEKTKTPNTKAVPKSKSLSKGSKIVLTAPTKTTLYYTINGKKPTKKSFVVKPGRTKAILINKKKVIKVFAIKSGQLPSNIVARTYKLRK